MGLAFHPDHKANGRFFVNYNRREDGATVVAEYSRQGRSLQAAGDSEHILMVVPQPYLNHNGGMIAFGPDRLLYIGRGDGGSRGDPQNRAQNSQEWLGKILRIDVDRDRPYAIPPDNPYAAGGGRAEIFALGIRNPWRFSFDRETGLLWLADVGQYKWEEVDLVVAGGNYGWRIMEGAHCYNPEEGCSVEGLIFPIAEYGHEQGRCSITGGYVYRGTAVPTVRGTYLFGDYCSGELFALSASANRRSSTAPRVLMQTGLRISSFGEDEAGELYIVDYKGRSIDWPLLAQRLSHNPSSHPAKAFRSTNRWPFRPILSRRPWYARSHDRWGAHRTDRGAESYPRGDSVSRNHKAPA